VNVRVNVQSECESECVSECESECVSEYVSEYVSECVSECGERMCRANVLHILCAHTLSRAREWMSLRGTTLLREKTCHTYE